MSIYYQTEIHRVARTSIVMGHAFIGNFTMNDAMSRGDAGQTDKDDV